MDRAALADQLILSDEPARAALLEQHAALLDVELAATLKDLCLAAWMSDPTRAVRAAGALAAVAHRTSEPIMQAFAAWAGGIAALVGGDMKAAIAVLDSARTQFEAVGQFHTVASTQVSRLVALTMVGRYEDAIATGVQARDVFVEHGDLLAAGKIEQNLGNIYCIFGAQPPRNNRPASSVAKSS